MRANAIPRTLYVVCVAIWVATVPAGAAKNIILLIGDGMGYQHVNAGSYYLTGAAGNLCFEPFYRCPVKTRSLNSTITDSAAAGTAIATGYKVNNGVVSQAPDGTPYETILERAKTMGKRTGLVTTVPITHATPAAFGAHEPSRNNYINIGNDYLNSSRPEIIFGAGDPNKGGSSYFSASQVSTAQALGYQVAYNYTQMAALNPQTVSRALGLFAGSEMTYEYDRLPSNTEPHLSEMTAKALEVMEMDPDGFFLMVEGGKIDYASHGNHIQRTTREVVEFQNAVQIALNWMQGRSDTLMIVTADHETGGLTAFNQGIGNYPTATWSSTDHTAADVPIYLTGADAYLIEGFVQSGKIDNTDVYRIMRASLDTPAPSSLGQIRNAADGTRVSLVGKVVTAVFADAVYVEEDDRSAGLRITGTPLLLRGDRVAVSGTIGTTNGERTLAADVTTILARGQTVPKPLAIRGSALAGGVGLNNIGLLVRTAGRVTERDPGGAWFRIDDGSIVARPMPKVVLPAGATAPADGAFVGVTGISACEVNGPTTDSVIRVRQSSDIRTY